LVVTMLAYLLDTNTLIALLRGRDRLAPAKFIENEGRIATSTVSVMELEYGSARSHDPAGSRRAVTSLLSRLEVLPYDQAAAEQTGRVRAELAAAGTPIGPYDAMIAGHARSLGLTVVTNNIGEFTRVRALQVEDWRQPATNTSAG
jgi:tRNA(fMet)-specific endonuclease VapC